ncbi:MAG: LysE family translocator [Bacteroidota bacterium]|jgi:threonine/homoserine/homoserine lactone efflux protein
MTDAVLKGLLLGFFLAISVGPVIFAIIKHSINHGKKAGYYLVAGISASDILLVLVAHFFTQLFHSLLVHRQAIAIGGGVFLVLLGLYTLFIKKVKTDEENRLVDKEYKAHQYAGMFLSGFLINMLNPAVFLFWLAWTTAVHADAENTAHPNSYQFIVFGTCLLFVLATDLLKVLMADKLRKKLTQPVLRIINIVSGVILVGFGLALATGILSSSPGSHL